MQAASGARPAAGCRRSGARHRDRAQPGQFPGLPRTPARQRTRGAGRLRSGCRQGRGRARRERGERQRSGCPPGTCALSRARPVPGYREISRSRRVPAIRRPAWRLHQRNHVLRAHPVFLRRRCRAPRGRARPIRPVLHLPPIRPGIRRSRTPGRAFRIRLATPRRPEPELRRVEGGHQSGPPVVAVPRREHGDARGPTGRRNPRRDDRVLRERLLLAPDEAGGRRPRAARYAGTPGTSAVRAGGATRRGAPARRSASVPRRDAARAARSRAGPRSAHHLALLRDSSAAPALPVASARPRLASARPRRQGESALGAEGAGVGGRSERGTRIRAPGLRDLPRHDPGNRGRNRAYRRHGCRGLRVPRPDRQGRYRAALSRRDRTHGGDQFPLPGDGRTSQPRDIARIRPARVSGPRGPDGPLSVRRVRSCPGATIPVASHPRACSRHGGGDGRADRRRRAVPRNTLPAEPDPAEHRRTLARPGGG